MLSLDRPLNKPVHWCAFASGYFASIFQILIVRESLAVFAGNEVIIGSVFGLWLGAGALGSRFGQRFTVCHFARLSLFLIISGVAGVYAIRAIPRLFSPGEMIPPLMACFILVLTEMPVAFLSGCIFSVLAKQKSGFRIYSSENLGSLAGLIVVSVMVGFRVNHIWVGLAAMVPLLFFVYRKPLYCAAMVMVITVYTVFNGQSVHWKYAIPVSKVTYGHEGEVAFVDQGRMVFLNGMLYRSEMPSPLTEQRVHLPMSIVPEVRRVLLIGDAGYVAELQKYTGIDLLCIETERELIHSGCVYQNPEELQGELFDVILLGGGIPQTVASGRYYTKEFFQKMQSLLSDSGVFSFSFALNPQYLDKQEKALKNIVTATLSEVFKVVKLYPGEGHTFVASNHDFRFPEQVVVETGFFGSQILPSVSSERIALANKRSDQKKPLIHRINHPLLLVPVMERYLDQFGIKPLWVAATLLLCSIGTIIGFIRSPAMLSVSTTGFITGYYSCAVMLLYQMHSGMLYSRISMLLIALAFGFVAGSRVRTFPVSDLVIGGYALLTLLVIFKMTDQSILILLLCNGGIGFLSAAQFVTRKGAAWGLLNASDLAGGVIGMILGTTVLIPLVGVGNLAIAALVLKIAVCFRTSMR